MCMNMAAEEPSAGRGAASPAGLLAGHLQWLADLEVGGLSAAELVDLLDALEAAKNAACATQARAAVALDADQRARQRAVGLPERRVGKGVAEQVALARRESPHRGSRLLGLAKALCGSGAGGPAAELPAAMRHLAAGRVSEWRVTLLARETACLDPDVRRAVDAELAPTLPHLSDRALVAAARAAAYRADPQSVVERRAAAAKDRYVSLRPAPEGMTYLTAFLPLRDGVACYAALVKAADAARATGDERSRGQVMADTLATRVTGLSAPGTAPVEVTLVMSDAALHGDEDPAYVPGYGPIPADAAREWLADPEAAVWVRRLFTDPVSGGAVEIDERRRSFPARLRRLIVARDRYCRTPWCGAPIRHIDHVEPYSDGGPTNLANGAGLCERCNQAKTAPAWWATVQAETETGKAPPGRHTIRLTTPTGHTYSSTAPPLRPPRPDAAPLFTDFPRNARLLVEPSNFHDPVGRQVLDHHLGGADLDRTESRVGS